MEMTYEKRKNNYNYYTGDNHDSFMHDGMHTAY